MKKLILISIAISLQACSVNINKTLGLDTNVTSNSYSYNLSQNGCSTGEHSFSSLESMCDGLRNDFLNNNCASSLRFDKFQKECPGRAW